MITLSSKKFETENQNQKYHCKICDYYGGRKSQYDRHIKSKKHLKKVTWTQNQTHNGNKKGTLVDNQCSKCGKKYKHRSGLSRHYKNCGKSKKKIVENGTKCYPVTIFDDNNEFGEKSIEAQNLKEKVKVLELEKKILEKDLECAKTINTMKDQMLEMQKSNATTNNNYKDCAINNTQNININLFLNKDCKNAMNLEDFVDNIKVQLEDILYQGEVGAAEGITNIITKQLKDMPVTKRPLHCTDEKRLQFYVREKE